MTVGIIIIIVTSNADRIDYSNMIPCYLSVIISSFLDFGEDQVQTASTSLPLLIFFTCPDLYTLGFHCHTLAAIVTVVL